MDDLVTRLRTPYVEPCICIDVVRAECRSCCDRIDAKREIERLREQAAERIDLQAIKNIVGSLHDLLHSVRRQQDTHSLQAETIKMQQAEIERLQAAGDMLFLMLSDAHAWTADGEIEALNAWQEARRG